MLIFIWSFILLLAIAVIFLIWAQFSNQNDVLSETQMNLQLEEKVIHLEENLKKTLEIMQDLAKKMHIQQQVLDKTSNKLSQVELQNAELVGLLAKAVNSSDRPSI
jgi:preprotein translocase subunit SecF